MRCPHCKTENRDDRATCYHCGKDLAMLRLLINRAKSHFNTAVEHAGEGHLLEALGELDTALELNSALAEAHVLRGTILARLNRAAEAEDAWRAALQLNPQSLRAHRNLAASDQLPKNIQAINRSYVIAGIAVLLAAIVSGSLLYTTRDGGGITTIIPKESRSAAARDIATVSGAWSALNQRRLAEAEKLGNTIRSDEERIRFHDALESEILDRLFAAERHERADEDREARQLLESIAPLTLTSKLKARYTAVHEKLETKLANTTRELVASAFARASKAIDAGDTAAFGNAVKEIQRFDDPKGDNARQLSELESRMASRRSQILTSKLTTAIAEERWRDAIAAERTLRAADIAIDATQQEELEYARKQLALQSYYALMEMADKIDAGNLSEAEARQVLDLAEETKAGLPPRVRPRAEQNIAEFVASATKRLQSTQ